MNLGIFRYVVGKIKLKGGTDNTVIGNTGDKLKTTDGSDIVTNHQPYHQDSQTADRVEQAVQASFSPQATDLLAEIVDLMQESLIYLKKIEHHHQVITGEDFDDVQDEWNNEEL